MGRSLPGWVARSRKLKKRQQSFRGSLAENNARHDALTGGSRVLPITFLMPFGSHEGKPLAEVPIDYLRWIATIPALRPHVRVPIANFLAVRDSEAGRKAMPW